MIVTHLLDESPESNANFCSIGRCSQTRLDWAAFPPFSPKLDVEISGPKGCSSRGKPWSRQDEPHLRPRGRNWTRGMGVCPEPWTINPRADSELHGVLQWFCVGYPVVPRDKCCLVPRPVDYHMHFCCEHWRKLTNSYLTISPSRSWCESTSRSRQMCPTSSAQTCRCQTVNMTLPKANRPTNRLDRVLGSRGVTGCS